MPQVADSVAVRAGRGAAAFVKTVLLALLHIFVAGPGAGGGPPGIPTSPAAAREGPSDPY